MCKQIPSTIKEIKENIKKIEEAKPKEHIHKILSIQSAKVF